MSNRRASAASAVSLAACWAIALQATAQTNERAASFPRNFVSGEVPTAPNNLGIESIYVLYPNAPGAQPEIDVTTDEVTKGGTTYFGFNDDGVWVNGPDLVPKSNGKPFTVKLVNGKAEVVLRDRIPRGLHQPSQDYRVYVNDLDAAQNGTVTPASGRAPGFPPTLQGDYVTAAPNTLGITTLFVNYPDSPNAQPDIGVFTAAGTGFTQYYGFNAEGVWVTSDQRVPLSGGKPFTTRSWTGRQ